MTDAAWSALILIVIVVGAFSTVAWLSYLDSKEAEREKRDAPRRQSR